MKFYYLITALDKLTGNIFHPNPGLFRTEKEVIKYLKKNDTKTLVHAAKKIYIGRMI
ncbi:MAG: hypothetical protein Q7R95_11325 [bacterium]|nr:hypothetical protein [bacterium]